MRYAAILGNDALDALDGFAVSFWTQGFHSTAKDVIILILGISMVVMKLMLKK